MKIHRQSNCRILVLLLTLATFVIVGVHFQAVSIANNSYTLDGEEFVNSNARLSSLTKKEFVYLAQAESCLSQHITWFIKAENISKRRDVIVLSWGQPCMESSANSSGVNYFYQKNTTWSEGRNILYRLAMKRREKYRYYIFMDEDIEFSFTPNTSEDIYSRDAVHPLEAYENFLLGYEPAIGLCDYCSKCGKILPNGSIVPALCCSTRPADGNLPPILPVTIAFDAAINAFHADAIGHILPYRLDYEEISWWESQKYVILASDILFRGQVLRYTHVTAINNDHRDYPQQILDNWADILKDIRNHVPEKLRNHSVFNTDPVVNMVPVITGNVVHTLLWNISIPEAKTPIVPYRHFDQ
ncbi:uncharacterized protein [Montipora capricornis]|uniref:uncharacterized protein n=1 Tax=Montipora capricornis TaxID=246305 RepID=UPI0035F150F1